MRPVEALLPGARWLALATVDPCGRMIGKRRPAADWPALLAEGLPMPDFHLVTGPENRPHTDLAVTGAATGFPNGRLFPDPAAGFRSPAEPDTVYALCQPHHADGRPAEEAPRRILARQVARLADFGLTARAASELEFYAFADPPEALAGRGIAGLRPLHHRGGDNDLLIAGRHAGFYDAVAEALAEAGIGVDQMQGEAGPGQCEINMAPTPPLEAADNHAAFKHIVKALAAGRGMAVTFLARPFAREAGSGGHIHLSLALADGTNALASAGGTNARASAGGTNARASAGGTSARASAGGTSARASAGGTSARTSAGGTSARTSAGGTTAPAGAEGLSPLGRAFLGGILRHAPEWALLHAPYANSYRRLVPGAFAPLRADWAAERRTPMLRLVGAGAGLRLEFRLPGADANPCLSHAALLAAGLAGIETGCDLPAPETGPPLPADLTEAVAAFAASDTAEAAFGTEVKAHLLALARHELAAARAAVTDWDIARGFEIA